MLPESDNLIDSNVVFNRVVKRLLRKVEKTLLPIELGGTEITVFLKGEIHLSSYPLKEVEYRISPNLLPQQVQSKIEGVISRPVSKHLPKKEPPAN